MTAIDFRTIGEWVVLRGGLDVDLVELGHMGYNPEFLPPLNRIQALERFAVDFRRLWGEAKARQRARDERIYGGYFRQVSDMANRAESAILSSRKEWPDDTTTNEDRWWYAISAVKRKLR